MAVDIGSITSVVLSRELVRTVFPVNQLSDPPLADLPDDAPRWNFQDNAGSPISLTYAFSASAPSYDPGDVNDASYTAFSIAEKAVIESGLGLWSEMIDASFTLTANAAAADIVFREVDITPNGVAGFAFFPPQGGQLVQNGDVYLDPNGGSTLSVVVHELGHALGLGHTFEGGTRPTPEDLGFDDSELLSIMSYTSPPRDLLLTVTNGGNGFSYASFNDPAMPMPVDILAAQMLYGANTATRATNTTYSYGVDPVFYKTIWDGGGIDTIDVSNQTRPSLISLVEGSFSTIAYRDPFEGLNPTHVANLQGLADRFFDGSNMLAIAFDAVIENASGGSAGDRLIGNAVKNILKGNGGNDSLTGAAGNDALDGGLGIDSLDGGAGNDSLSGGGSNDTLRGGIGNDTYTISGTDALFEQPGGGIDLVKAAVNFTLGTNLEKLTLTGAGNFRGTGNTLANTLAGNGGANLLAGLGGNDSITGGNGNDTLRGGLGKDTLAGGANDDSFTFDTTPNGAANLDVITDFNPLNDTVVLDKTAFGALVLGTLASVAFRSGAGIVSAGDADDRIIYNTSNGALFYDADGNAAGSAAVQFATLSGHPTLTSADFLVIA